LLDFPRVRLYNPPGMEGLTMMRLPILTCIGMCFALCACSSGPAKVEREPALAPGEKAPGPKLSGERLVMLPPADYTKDWRTIADLAGKPTYFAYTSQILWRRRNWRMTLSGEWADDLVEDMQRRLRWDKKLKEWVQEKGNPEWPK
jgi:hypothetical protein